VHVEEDRFWTLLSGDGEAMLAGGRKTRLERRALEQSDDRLTCGRIIVDDQDEARLDGRLSSWGNGPLAVLLHLPRHFKQRVLFWP